MFINLFSYLTLNVILNTNKTKAKGYLKISKEVVESYAISNYSKQRIRLVEGAIASLFENEKVKECTMEDFF